MKVYKNKYELPIWNWIMISENGFNLKYLLKKNTRLNKKKNNILYKTYLHILDSLEEMEFKLLQKYVIWQASLTTFRADILKEKVNELSKEDFKKSKTTMEDDFRAYLEELQKIYKEFEVTEYYFAEDYKKIYKELTNEEAPKEIDIFKGIRFYDWFEYKLFANKHPEILLLAFIPTFNEKFIKKRTIKLENIIGLDTFLSDIFAENNKYNDYQIRRSKLFDLNAITASPKEKHSGFTEVSQISNILKININTKETTLAEFEAHKNTAHRIAEEMKPKENGRI